MRRFWRIAGVAAALALAGAGSAPAGAVEYGAYHDLAEVEQALAAAAAAHPARVEVITIGESAGGRPLLVAQIAGDGPVAPGERPAVFVGANIVGFHNAGTEAALHLLETLLGDSATELLSGHTFYVAPALNPDAHDALFATPHRRRGGADGRLDRDRDGFTAEDGPDDLDGDGRITQLRIADPAGRWLPHPEEPRLMVEADAARGWSGAFRLETEGDDGDGDGAFNEDGPHGVWPSRSFAHAFPYPDPEAGPWPSFAPEAKALMDFLLARRNVAAAVVYGPANNLLALPQPLGEGGDLGTQTFKIPERAAEFIGLDPEQEYTLDEVWAVAQDLPFVRQNNISKEQLARFLGAGAANELEDDDRAALDRLAKAYKERLEAAGLDAERPATQYAGGGLTPWLYYQYGALAIELDVWGIPKAAAEDDGEATGEELTLERLAQMSSDEFLALPEETVAAFLEEIGAPPQFTAAALRQRVESGQVTPEQMAQMAQRMAGGGGGGGGADGEDDAATKRRREVLAWVDANSPEAFSPWSEVTLPDGRRAEAGGLDPFIEIAPPHALLEPALAVHTETVLDLARRLPRLEIVSLGAEALGGGVYRVEVVAANRGELASHTKLAERAQSHLPVRLALVAGDGAERLTGRGATTSERLAGTTGTLSAQWLVRAADGAEVTVELSSDQAGADRRSLTLEKGGE